MIPLTIIIPAYNEESSIKETLGELIGFCKQKLKDYQIIVVDDASRDRTGEIAKAYGEVTVMRNPVNIGYGGSIKRALPFSAHKYILIMDGDGTYPAAEIEQLMTYARDFDMVIGARKGKHYRGSLFKNISRKIFYILVKYVTGENIPDVNSGLRIFQKDKVMRFYNRLCNGFSFTTTITIALISTGHLVKHVDITYKKRIGSSKVRFLRDSLRTLQILVEAISYFNPIKAFLPFCIAFFLLFSYFGVRYVILENMGYLFLSIFCMAFSVLFFSFGMLGYIFTKGKDE